MTTNRAGTSRALPVAATELGLTAEPLVAAKREPLHAHLRAAVDTQLRVLLARQEGLRAGDDPEDVHQLRVAARRLRAILREQGNSLGEAASELRAELRWLASSFGELRDLDVLIEGLTEDAALLPEADQAAFFPVLEAFRAHRKEARKLAMRTLRTARYRKLLQRLADAVLTEEPAAAARPATSAVGQAAGPKQLISRPYRKMRKDVARASDPPTDAELHELRIRGKRLRYSAEFSAPRGAKQTDRTKQLIKATKRLQTVLGTHNDLVIAEERLRELLGAESLDTEAILAAGRLLERRSVQIEDCRLRWRKEWAVVDKHARALL
ncbi:CHAD domain-containing protein [Tamaricihabitans halophyticus]|uniref:CHAD domain-containing protein n=1 Tax=Tamaricihabitans halophyticus TaxID=1262583 RepID=A0A4R2R2K3_9PSEU|nr:CHAD domain-containing protein [Tamaricihabitans halophyticus]TCP56237.1 CHAD domain-containing protein [Tamaricihabitans halophyticus]